MNTIHEAFQDKTYSFPINQTTKLYPFHGESKYLFDKFIIIGYDSATITQNVIPIKYKSQTQNKQQDTFLSKCPPVPFASTASFTIDIEPLILSEICSDYEKVLLDNETILKLIFPNKPLCYYYSSDYLRSSKRQEHPSSYSIVFNSNPSSNEGLKKSYNGLAYVVYESHVDEVSNGCYYIPIVFVVLSEFPYYACYMRLLIEIQKMFKMNNLELPIEVTLYNLIRYTPSPMYSNISIQLPKQMKNKNNNNNNDNTKLIFHQLTGLPILDINIRKIFYYLGPQNILKLFLFSFLEKDILIFGSNIELISLVIYTFYSLTYPLNDGNYYWLNATVSYMDLITENSVFAGRSYPTMLGVHSQYNPLYIQYSKLNDHFVLDLDNNTFEYNPGKDKDSEDVKRVNNFLQFLKKTIKGNNALNKVSFYHIIRNLYTELESLCAKKPIRPLKFYEDVNEASSKTAELLNYNDKVQELFFKCIINIIGLLYRNITLHSEMDLLTNKNDRNRLETTFYNEYAKDNELIQTEEDKFFYEQLRGTFKFSSFIEGFVKSHNENGLYQMPFIFLDEFANVLSRKNVTLDEYTIIGMIKDIYFNKYRLNKPSLLNSGMSTFRKTMTRLQTKEEITFAKSKEHNDVMSEGKETVITFPSFELMHNADMNYMQRLYDTVYTLESSSEPLCVISKDTTILNISQGSVQYTNINKSKSNSDKNGLYKYTQSFLSQHVLMKYIKYLNDIDNKTIEQMIPWVNLHLSNEIKEIKVSQIANVVENVYVNSKQIDVYNFIINDIILLFTLTIPLANHKSLIENMLLFSEFLSSNFSGRKYFKELLFVLEHLSHSINEDLNKSIKVCIGIVLNKLREKEFVSSEALTKLINYLNDNESEGFFYDSDDSITTPFTINIINNSIKKGKPRDKAFYITFITEHPEWEDVLENFPSYPKLTTNKSKDNKDENTPQIEFIVSDVKIVTKLYSPKTIFNNLSELRDKLIYNVNKVNEIKITTECLKYYCACLVFYVNETAILRSGGNNSVVSVLIKIIQVLIEYEKQEKEMKDKNDSANKGKDKVNTTTNNTNTK